MCCQNSIDKVRTQLRSFVGHAVLISGAGSPAFDLRAVRIGFVVNQMALARGFLLVLRPPPLSPTYALIRHPVDDNGSVDVAVP